MNTDILWNNFLDKIKDRISPLSYDTWFKDTKLYKIDKSTAIIEVPMILHKKHLEENYLDEIEEKIDEFDSLLPIVDFFISTKSPILTLSPTTDSGRI